MTGSDFFNIVTSIDIIWETDDFSYIEKISETKRLIATTDETLFGSTVSSLINLLDFILDYDKMDKTSEEAKDFMMAMIQQGFSNSKTIPNLLLKIENQIKGIDEKSVPQEVRNIVKDRLNSFKKIVSKISEIFQDWVNQNRGNI